jgi:hypothetical protein
VAEALLPHGERDVRGLPGQKCPLTFGEAGPGVLLDLGWAELSEIAQGWRDRVDTVTACCCQRPEIAAMLLRPDGYTAWIAPSGSEAQPGPVREALATWFGTERRSVPTARHLR